VKILQVVTAFPPAVAYGGPSVVAAQQVDALARQGHQVTVATSSVMDFEPVRFVKSCDVQLSSADVKYFPSWLLRSHFAFIISGAFSTWLRREVKNFDIVHVHFAREWIPVRAAQIAVSKKIPTFLQPHGMLGNVDGARNLIDRLWVKQLLESATGVFCLQQHETNEIKRIAPHAKTLGLPNGVSLSASTAVGITRDKDKPIILFLARLHPRKRVLAFVEMARILRDRGVEAFYQIAGPDGGDLAEAKRSVQSYKLQNRVTFLGSLQGEAVAQTFAGSSTYVLPAVDEPFPMTVLEAMSLGVPTIVTNKCYIAPFLEEKGAVLVSSKEPAMLAAAVERILHEPELAKRLSSAGRQLIRQQLTVERVTERLESYYKSAL
jgi:glycosyltransferase involved in cell wall biosynthesis